MSVQKTLKDVIKDEYKKCLVEPMYFMKKYVKIQHQTRGIIPFELYPFQEETLQDFIDHDRNIVLKSRQMGISTLVSAYALWTMIFHPGKNVLILSTVQNTSKYMCSPFGAPLGSSWGDLGSILGSFWAQETHTSDYHGAGLPGVRKFQFANSLWIFGPP